jgi:hypothetical protein
MGKERTILIIAINRVSNKPFHKFVDTGCNPKPPPINQIIRGQDNNQVSESQGVMILVNF